MNFLCGPLVSCTGVNLRCETFCEFEKFVYGRLQYVVFVVKYKIKIGTCLEYMNQFCFL